MEYFNLLIVLWLSLTVSLLIFILSYVIIRKHYTIEKISTYECGFEPFHDSRNKFDIRFYLIAILFLVFDLEIILLFPWCVGQIKTSFLSTFVALLFLGFLTLAYAYEWKKGGMDWNR